MDKKRLRKKRWYRQNRRNSETQRNAEYEEDSDHSGTESDASSNDDEKTAHSNKRPRPNRNANRNSSSSGEAESVEDNPNDQVVDDENSSHGEAESATESLEDNVRPNVPAVDENRIENSADEVNDEDNGNEENEAADHRHYEIDHVDSPEGPNDNSSANHSPGASDLSSAEAESEESSEDNSSDNNSNNSNANSDVENESEGEEDDGDDFNNRPIYEGAQITFKESLMAILTFILTHKVTGLCANDLLTLIAMHCAPENICLKTIYKFKTFFNMIGKKLIICHFYCALCEISLQNKDSVCNTCNDQSNTAYFIEFPIVTQLQSMYKRPGFYESLMFRFNREKKCEENIEDIYDGSIYKELSADGAFLSNYNNISFFMYFDGIALFKSSSFSIWPVYLTINELKYKLRTKQENTIIAGIWFGKSKPNPNLFLEPMQEKLSALEREGVDMELPGGQKIRVKGKLIGAVGDMPAKSTFMRFKQYNGAYSCFHCMDKGGRFQLVNTTATIQVFPYNRNFQLRTVDETVLFGDLAVTAREADPEASVYGVKGPTLLAIMLPNFILCMAQDIMHGVFLGAMKTIATLWFDTQFAGQPYSISALVNLVDRRLKSIKPPFSFQRFPRSLAKEFALLKASDWKALMLIYSLPVLIGILPQPYWLHHCKLVTAISILCQESISVEEIDAVEEILHEYVSEFQALYGIRYLSLTFHQLLHLPLVVKSLGPAWVYSCFFYESLNGELARLVHGSRHVALQICSSSSVFMNLTVMTNTLPEGEVKQFCNKLQQKGALRVKLSDVIDNQTNVVGRLFKYLHVPDNYKRLLRETFNVEGGLWYYFLRLKIKGNVFTSEFYLRNIRKLSCYVEIFHENVPYLCKINCFVKWSDCNENCAANCNCQKLYVCFVTLYDRIAWEIHEANMEVFPSYLNKVTPSEKICVFPVTAIRSACLYMSIDGSEFLALPVNSLEIE